MLREFGYAALCVAVPAVWGIAIYGLTTLIERRALHKPGTLAPNASTHDTGDDARTLPLDYNI